MDSGCRSAIYWALCSNRRCLLSPAQCLHWTLCHEWPILNPSAHRQRRSYANKCPYDAHKAHNTHHSITHICESQPEWTETRRIVCGFIWMTRVRSTALSPFWFSLRTRTVGVTVDATMPLTRKCRRQPICIDAIRLALFRRRFARVAHKNRITNSKSTICLHQFFDDERVKDILTLG